MTTQEAYELAAAHFRAGRMPQAEFILQQVITRDPRHADAQHLLALLSHHYGHTPIAVGLVRRAIYLNPNAADYYNSLATFLADQGAIDSALTAVRKALSLRSDFPEAIFNLGGLLARNGELDEAVASLCRTLSLKPAYPDAEFRLGKLLKQIGQIDEAISCFQRAAGATPDPRIRSALLHALYFHPDQETRQIADAHAQWKDRFANPLEGKIRPAVNPVAPAADRKLRIGYVSPNFRDHFIGRLLAPLLANHDRSRFEIYCYSDVARPDEITRRFDSFDHVWRNTVGISDDDLAEQVRRDRIDVLVDLSLHLEGNRLLAFAQKPAPVQVTYLAYAGTSGLHTMDYRLADSCLDVTGDAAYTEQPVRLSSYFCYEPPAEAPDVGPLPMEEAGHVTFGCLNDYSKISTPAWSAWRQLLASVENSTLLVHSPPGNHREAVRSQFAQDGIDPGRLQFVPRLSRDEYLRLYSQIDIALDPFPYPGALTNLDALWMGVPVISLAGATGVWRTGLSILTNAGLPELVATTPGRYVQIAAALAADITRLANLRGSLRDRLRQSPLTNAKAFAKDVESAYRSMWRDLAR
jgi:protein O-GlcNAc transferase